MLEHQYFLVCGLIFQKFENLCPPPKIRLGDPHGGHCTQFENHCISSGFNLFINNNGTFNKSGAICSLNSFLQACTNVPLVILKTAHFLVLKPQQFKFIVNLKF